MGVSSGVVKRVARGAAMGVLAIALAACSSSGGGAAPADLQKALSDYFAGNVPLAKSEFQAVVKQDPGSKFGWYNLGVIAQNAGDNKEAADDYLKAIAIDATFEGPLYNLGLVRYQAGNFNEAIKYLQQAIALEPNDANAHWNLGLAYGSLRTPTADAQAKTQTQKALDLDPTLLNAYRPKGGSGAIGGTARAAAGSGPIGAAPTTTTPAAP